MKDRAFIAAYHNGSLAHRALGFRHRCSDFIGLVLALALLANSVPALAQAPALHQSSLPKIDAGTAVLGVADPDRIASSTLGRRWNRTVLLARPNISSGDVGSLAKSIRDSVSSFVLTVLATVEAYTDEQTGESKFRLKEVGVGYSAAIDGGLTVISLEAAPQLGLSLGFIQRQLLHENEKQLKKVHYVARTSTLAIFDAPAIVLRNGKHRDFTMRHFVWIDSRTGENAALVWLLERDLGGELRVVDEPIRHLPPGFKEDRQIHVDGNEFTLGIPSERAFALTELPPGKQLPWLDAAKAVAAKSSYSMDDIRQLTIGLNAALAKARSRSSQ